MAASVATRRPEERPGRPLFLDDRFEQIGVVPMPIWKRGIDVTGAAAGLLLLSPLIVLIAIMIVLDSRGGPFFRQTRVGHGGRTFTCWKFRSMLRGADLMRSDLLALNEANGRIFKIRDDPRRTRMGRMLRKSSLDELPQLINVLRGDMSLVGPRPPLVSEVLEYEADELRRLATVPGITGLWQVTLRGRHDFEDMIALDVRYAAELSFWLDVKILAKTIPTVLFGRGAC
jgi:lipopolysaccharide/colanic/teichoic acid biosynthesis glycosyltransferase